MQAEGFDSFMERYALAGLLSLDPSFIRCALMGAPNTFTLAVTVLTMYAELASRLRTQIARLDRATSPADASRRNGFVTSLGEITRATRDALRAVDEGRPHNEATEVAVRIGWEELATLLESVRDRHFGNVVPAPDGGGLRYVPPADEEDDDASDDPTSNSAWDAARRVSRNSQSEDGVSTWSAPAFSVGAPAPTVTRLQGFET